MGMVRLKSGCFKDPLATELNITLKLLVHDFLNLFVRFMLKFFLVSRSRMRGRLEDENYVSLSLFHLDITTEANVRQQRSHFCFRFL